MSELQHYGVLGMKWGRRRGIRKTAEYKAYKKAKKIKKLAKRNKTAARELWMTKDWRPSALENYRNQRGIYKDAKRDYRKAKKAYKELRKSYVPPNFQQSGLVNYDNVLLHNAIEKSKWMNER